MEKRVYYNRQTAGSAGFSPLQLPRFLFSGDTPAYAELSQMTNDAKVLYALLLDRLSTNEMSINFLEKPWHNDEKLPVKLHGGYDEHGNAYVHYDFAEIKAHLNISIENALEVMTELEANGMVKIFLLENGVPLKIYPLSPALSATS